MTLTPEFIAIGRVLAFVVCAWFASGLGMACTLPTAITIDQWRTRHGKDTLNGGAYTLTVLAWWVAWTLTLWALIR